MAVATTRPDESIATGVAWMVATTVCFVLVTVVVRYVGTDLPAAQSAFLRYAFGIVLLAPMLGPLFRRSRPARTWRLYAVRGAVHAVAVTLWFFAMARIPIAEVTALGYVAPIFVTIGAAFYFGERLYLRRISAVLAGFLGALIILRPGFQEINWGQLAQLGAAPLFAISFLMAKKLTEDEDPAVIVAMLTVFCTIGLLPGALMEWVAPSLAETALLGLTAVFATAGHYTMTRAMRAAPLTVTQPVTFLQLVWATILGVVLFGEPVDPFVVLGGGVVVASATFIAHREAVAARRPTTPPAPALKE